MGAGDEGCAVVIVHPDGREVVVGRLSEGRADLALVGALARLQLAARRQGCTIGLRVPCAELGELLDLVGLPELAGPGPGSGVEAGREAEGGE